MNVPALIFRADDEIILAANDSAGALYGCAPEDLVGTSLLARTADIDRSASLIQNVLTERSIAFETVQYSDSGAPLELEVRATRIDIESQPAVFSVNIDVSARNAAERRREESVRRFRAMLERGKDHIGLITPDGISLYASPSSHLLLGYQPEQLVGTNVLQMVHRDDLPVVRKALDRIVAQGGTAEPVEIRVRHAKGHWCWLECSATNLLDEPCVGALVVNSRDVSIRRELNEQLRASEERYRNIVELASEGVWVLGPDGRTTLVNETMAKMLGYDISELMPRTPGELATPESRQACQFEPEQCDGNGRSQREVDFVHKHGQVIHTLVSTSAVYGPAGEFEGVLSMIMDVTARLQLEEQLRHTQKMEAVGHLAGGIAHHFNNQLTVILSNCHLLRKCLPAGHPGLTRLQDAIRAASRVESLTSQLLAFGRRQMLSPEILDLNIVVADITDFLRQVAGEDIEFSFRAAPQLLRVRADRTQLEHVVMELVVNARNAIVRGGSIEIQTMAETAGPTEDWACLIVRDDGPGMAASIRERMFEPFFSTAFPGRSTGLGLSIVHGIVRQSGGEIDVHTKPGEGTAITIKLPAVRNKPAAADDCACQHRITPATILVVEDEPGVRTLVEEVLCDAGFDVMTAGSPGEAVEISGMRRRIDLLLTDVVMPEHSGAWVAERVLQTHPDTAVVYMSGYTDDELVRRGVLSGEVQLLSKPFSPGALELAVRRSLARAAQTAC